MIGFLAARLALQPLYESSCAFNLPASAASMWQKTNTPTETVVVRS